MEITVERAPVSQKHALDFSSSDVLENIQVAGGNNVLTYVEGETPYVSWTIKDNAVATWQMFKVNSSLSAETLAEYDYVRVKAMALSDDGVYRWRLLMCSDQYIAGDSEWNAPTRLALNEWGYIYVPMSAFLSGGNGFDKKCFVSVTFNKPQDGNADNVKEVRFADFELVKAAEGELLTEKTSYTTEENPSFTANVSPELAFKVEIRKNGEAVAALENVGGKYVWEGAKEPGTYEAVIVLTEGGYKLDGEYSVTFSVVEDTPAEDNAVFEPTEDSLAAQITTSKACAMQVKSGDPEAAYTGNYVSFSGAANNAWVNISLKAKGSFEEYGKYDVVEIWLYADAKDGDTVKFSFFNDLAYQKTFPADTWTKISIPAADFVAKMSKSTVFLPFNYNNANSENHASLTELRLGAYTRGIRSNIPSKQRALPLRRAMRRTLRSPCRARKRCPHIRLRWKRAASPSIPFRRTGMRSGILSRRGNTAIPSFRPIRFTAAKRRGRSPWITRLRSYCPKQAARLRARRSTYPKRRST